MKYTAYTDGSSRGNPGPSGWATIIMTDNTVKEYSGRLGQATNNQMEILGVLRAFNFASVNLNKNINDGDTLEVYSDSKYVVSGVNDWVYNWVRNNWKTSTKKEVLNIGLWKEIWVEISAMKERKIDFKVIHIYGHNGHRYNERADQICTSAALKLSTPTYSGKRDGYDDWIKSLPKSKI